MLLPLIACSAALALALLARAAETAPGNPMPLIPSTAPAALEERIS
jgi:hypothetical protein